MIYQEHRRRSVKAVLLDYEVFHNRMIALIEATSDADLLAVGRFKWMGPTWTLSDYCRAETASHYRWARKWIRRWKRAQDQSEHRKRLIALTAHPREESPFCYRYCKELPEQGQAFRKASSVRGIPIGFLLDDAIRKLY